jgi:hypothetical protein
MSLPPLFALVAVAKIDGGDTSSDEDEAPASVVFQPGGSPHAQVSSEKVNVSGEEAATRTEHENPPEVEQAQVQDETAESSSEVLEEQTKPTVIESDSPADAAPAVISTPDPAAAAEAASQGLTAEAPVAPTTTAPAPAPAAVAAAAVVPYLRGVMSHDTATKTIGRTKQALLLLLFVLRPVTRLSRYFTCPPPPP